jgi:hypothetical protein
MRVDMIMSTSTSSVLLNGVPGKKLFCKKEVRQGDPLSPIVFLSVSELLQPIVNHLVQEGILHAPLNTPNIDFHIVLYADNTLLILQACHAQLSALKLMIESFSQATGVRVK